MSFVKKVVVCGAAAASSVLTASAEGEIAYDGVRNLSNQVYSASHRWMESAARITKFGADFSWQGKTALYYSEVSRSDYWNSLEVGAYWADGEVPSSDKDYIVSGDHGKIVACGPAGGTVTFHGNKLIMGQTRPADWRQPYSTNYAVDNNSAYFLANGGKTVFENEGVELVYGGFIAEPNAFGGTFSGKFTVLSSESIPFYFYKTWTANASYTFDADSSFVGAAGTGLLLETPTDNRTAVSFLGDMSGYYGSITAKKWTDLTFGDGVTMPGSVTLMGDATLKFGAQDGAAKVTFGTLALSDSTAAKTIRIVDKVTDAGCLKLTDAFTADDTSTKPVVSWSIDTAGIVTDLNNDTYGYGSYYSTQGSDLAIVDLPESATPILSSFDISCTQAANNFTVANAYSYYSFVLGAVQPREVVADGRRKLMLKVPKFTTLITNTEKDTGVFDPANASSWYGHDAGNPLDADTACMVTGKFNNHAGNHPVDAGIHSLAMGWCSVFNMRNDLKLNLLELMPLSCFFHYGKASKHAASRLYGGRIFVAMGPTQGGKEANGYYPSNPCRLFGDNKLTVESGIFGDGILHINSNNALGWGHEKGDFTLVLAGDNSDYRGKFYIANNGFASNGYVTDVQVSEAKNLGLLDAGADTYNTIKLTAGGRLTATETFEYAQAKRGVYVENGQVGVAAEKTFKLGSPLTMGGTLTKVGAGTLALGGPLRFSSAQLDEPVTDMDIVEVREGALRGLNNGAADGLQIKLFPGAALEIASPTEAVSADENAYGLYNVMGWINCGESEGVLNVRLSEAGRYDADGNDLWPDTFARPICTVNNNEAGGLDGCIRLVARPRGVKLVSIETKANADGETTTFVAHFKRSGFAIIVR